MSIPVRGPKITTQSIPGVINSMGDLAPGEIRYQSCAWCPHDWLDHSHILAGNPCLEFFCECPSWTQRGHRYGNPGGRLREYSR